MSTKQCKTCKQEKLLEDYYNSKGNKGGKVPNCKSCMRVGVNPENVKAASKRYRDRHPEKRLERDRRYRKENPEKIKEARRAYQNEKYKSDPIYRTQRKLRSQLIEYLRHNKNELTAKLLKYTTEDFLSYHGEGNEDDHIDHKIPSSWFRDDAEVSLVWHLDNLQWLPAIENQSKSNRYMTPVSESYLRKALPFIKEEYISNIVS